jgi:branched-chain amino acid transport system substrate-binding protein
MRGIRVGSLFAASVAAVVVLSGCSTVAPEEGDDTGSGESFQIAYQGPITGGDAKYGSYAKAGIEVAIADYAEQFPDGPTVTSLYLDSQGDPAQAPPLATQAITDETILGIVGPAFSGETEATEPAYAEAGLVNVSPSATRVSLTDQGWNTFFRVVANDGAQGPAAAALLTDTVKAEKVFLVDDASAYGVGLSGEIAAALDPALVVGTDSVEKGSTTDFSATVTKVTSAGADAVYYSGYAVDAGLIVKQLRDAGWEGTYLSGDGTQDTTYIETAGEAAEGSLITAAAGAAGDDFVAKWEALDVSDKGEIGVYSTEAYDAAWVLLSGIADGNTTREDLLAWVAAYDEEGITKHIKFTETGEIDGAGGVYYYPVEDGKFAAPILID